MSLPLDRIPTPKSERWKYTNLPRALKDMDLTPATLGWGTDVSLLNNEAPGAAVYKDTQLWDLNTENTKDIRVITSSDDITIDAQDGQMISPRLVIHVKDGEEITVVERNTGAGSYWKNQVTQIVLGKNSRLHHIRMFDEAEGAVNTSFTHVKIDRDSSYFGFSFIEGAGVVRNQIHTEVHGENAHAQVSGINLLTGKQHADTTITIEHQAPNCTSNQTYKSVLADTAHCVFQGKVHVHKPAQKTDGYQLSNALILSPGAEMDTKPELEIYADDVKCSHGATTGKLDDEPLFYMRSRGIPEKAARALLIQSFCAPAMELVNNEDICATLEGRIETWLAKHL
jgi:Fe-S cluster assembly protein SufD